MRSAARGRGAGPRGGVAPACRDTGPRLLAVHAHPDDETLSTGALLATWAVSGAPVTVVTCTRGERGEVIGAALAHLEGDGPALAAHRERELAAALAALGVTDHVWLDALPAPDDAARAARYEDSGMTWLAPGRAGAAPDSGPAAFARADVETAARRLAALLRRRRPDVVVTYEPGGGYGHPDHVQAHRVTTRAVALATDAAADLPGTPLAPPVVLWAALDAAERATAEAELADRVARGDLADASGPADLSPGVGLPAAGRVASSAAVPRAEVDLRVDALPVLDRVVGALRAHATQVQAVRSWPDAPRGRAALGCLALSDGVLQPLPRHEAYRRVAGRLTDVRWPDGVSCPGVEPPPGAASGPDLARDSLTPVSAPAPLPALPAGAPTPTPRAHSGWQLLGSALLGVVVGIVGTGVHRTNQPWGLVLAYLTVVSAAVLARAWARGLGTAAHGLGLVATLLAMAFVRPGADVLITDEALGYAWIAAPLLLLGVALLPARLFSDRPMVRRRDQGQPS